MVDMIVREDSRYAKGAYLFMRHALDYTLKKAIKTSASHQMRHVSGKELCEGIQEFALEQFGPMTLKLFEQWGLEETGDFGEIVFNLIEYGIFGKKDSDSRADFEDVYSFKEAFETPFLPPSLRQINEVPSPANSDSSRSAPED